MADVLITYKTNADELKAAVQVVTEANQQISDSAKKAGKDASDSFKQTADAAKAAFASGEVKKALDNQIQGVDKLKAGLKQLYDEEIKILQAGDRQSAAYKKNQEEALKLRLELDKLSKGTQVYSRETGAVEKAAQSLKTQLKNLKSELNSLEEQGKENTKQFQETALAAAKLEDQIGDTNERVRVLASDTFKFDAAIGAVQGLAASFAVAQGLAATFGAESEDLNKVIAKTQGAIAILNGVQEIANLLSGQSAAKLAIQNFFMKDKVVVTTAAATATGALATAEEGAAVATLTTARSLNVLKIAIAGTGIGLLVIGLIALYKAWEDNEAATKKAKKALDDAADSTKKLRIENKDLTDQIIKSNDELLVSQGLLSESDARRRDAKRQYTQEVVKENAAQFAQIEVLKQREAELLKTLEGKIKAQQYAIEQDKQYSTEASRNAVANSQVQIDNTRKQYREQVKIRLDLQKEVDTNIKGKAQILANDLKIIDNEELKSKENTGKKKVEVAKKTNDDIKKIEEDRLNALLEEANAELDAQERAKIAGERYVADLKAIDQKRLDDLSALSDEELASNERMAAAEKAYTDMLKEENRKRIDAAFQYADAISQTFSAINDLSKQLTENRIADIQATSDAELIAINSTNDTERKKDKERAALAKKTAALVSAEKTKQAKQDKALAIFDIGINTAKGIISALALTPPNPILAAFIGATGVAKLAAVAAKPIPKFEKGGQVGGKRHSQGGTLIEAEEGEFITNRKQASKHRSILDAMNRSSEALNQYIEKHYVRPAVMNYVLSNKRDSQSINVKATLNSGSMENELRGLRKDMKKRFNHSTNSDSRYSWRNN